jgi:hypothetical protein
MKPDIFFGLTHPWQASNRQVSDRHASGPDASCPGSMLASISSKHFDLIEALAGTGPTHRFAMDDARRLRCARETQGSRQAPTGSLQRRKADHRASSCSCRLEDKRKQPPATRKGLEWRQCRCYQLVAQARVAQRTSKVAAQASSAGRERRYAHVNVRKIVS